MSEGSVSAQFHWNAETYLEMIQAEVSRFDELQKVIWEADDLAVVAASY